VYRFCCGVGGDRGEAFPINYSERGIPPCSVFLFRREEKERRKKLCNEKGGALEEGGSFSFWVSQLV